MHNVHNEGKVKYFCGSQKSFARVWVMCRFIEVDCMWCSPGISSWFPTEQFVHASHIAHRHTVTTKYADDTPLCTSLKTWSLLSQYLSVLKT